MSCAENCTTCGRGENTPYEKEANFKCVGQEFGCNCINRARNSGMLNNVTPSQDLCLDCGRVHSPSPCVECANCDRLFFLKQTGVTLSDDLSRGELWCKDCLEHRFDGEKQEESTSAQLELPWGKYVNE